MNLELVLNIIAIFFIVCMLIVKAYLVFKKGDVKESLKYNELRIINELKGTRLAREKR